MEASFYGNILEEELKNKVAADWFSAYDTTQIIGKIDFAVAVPVQGSQHFETEYLLWAEAKQGTSHDILESFIQLILTIGKALWKYYHEQPDAIADAALYDIRLHFQGTNDKGKMNTGSADEHYNLLMANLRQALKTLAQKIEPKVYEYGFLKR